MYQFYNPHPDSKEVRDCVKRAITKVTGLPYEEVQRELNRHKKITGCAKFNDNKNWKSYVINVLKATKLSFPGVLGEPRMNGHSFCYQYPTGSYLLRMAGHLVACVDGIIYDTWDCRDKCVYNAYKIG